MMSKIFQKYLLISFGSHVALIVVLVLWSFIFQPQPLNPTGKVKWINLSYGDGGTSLKSSNRKLKSMPKSTLAEQKKAIKNQQKSGNDSKSTSGNTTKKTTTTKKEIVRNGQKKGGINLSKKSTEDTQIDSALARIENLKKKQQAQLGTAQALDGPTGQSQTGSGTGTEISDQLRIYFDAVKRKVSREWVVVKSQNSGSLKSRVIVRIDMNGNIIAANIKQSSGDGSFDSSAMRAVSRAKPFPLPPSDIRSDLARDGFEFIFSPQSVSGNP